MRPSVLVDTSVLVRLVVKDHSPTVARVENLLGEGRDLLTVVHVMRECWAVLTRSPASNGYGLSPSQTRTALEDLGRLVRLVTDPPDAYTLWLDLCARTSTTGLHCHDAYLAACALALQTPILTRDRDFSRYGVSVV